MYVILSQLNFFGKKLIIFRERGVEGGWGGTPFAENSAKIINSIFEPFPNQTISLPVKQVKSQFNNKTELFLVYMNIW